MTNSPRQHRIPREATATLPVAEPIGAPQPTARILTTRWSALRRHRYIAHPRAARFERRLMGVAELSGEYADIGAAVSLATIRSQLAAKALQHGLEDVDAAAIRAAAPRGFTQEVSRLVYGSRTAEGEPLAGISYSSRLDDDTDNWAVFEPAPKGNRVVHRSVNERRRPALGNHSSLARRSNRLASPRLRRGAHTGVRRREAPRRQRLADPPPLAPSAAPTSEGRHLSLRLGDRTG